MSAIDDYRAALERLKAGKPTIVPKGSDINKDTVALEAGRKRGAIKKSREEFEGLIIEIEKASAHSPVSTQEAKINRLKARLDAIKQELKAAKKERNVALNKLVATVHQNFQLQQKIKQLGGDKISVSETIKLGRER